MDYFYTLILAFLSGFLYGIFTDYALKKLTKNDLNTYNDEFERYPQPGRPRRDS